MGACARGAVLLPATAAKLPQTHVRNLNSSLDLRHECSVHLSSERLAKRSTGHHRRMHAVRVVRATVLRTRSYVTDRIVFQRLEGRRGDGAAGASLTRASARTKHTFVTITNTRPLLNL